MSDLQVEFQRVIEETVAGNLATLSAKMAPETHDALLQAALMGLTAATVTYWFATGAMHETLGEARQALDAKVDEFWSQLVLGQMDESEGLTPDQE